MCGMLRPLVKFGKRFSFPSAPSSWVSRIAHEVESSQDRRPKSNILFPFPGSANANSTVDDDESYNPPPPPSFFFDFQNNNKEVYFWHDGLYDKTVSNFLATQIPQYSDYVIAESKSFQSIEIEIGQPFDVISLLSFSCGSNDKEKTYLFRPSNGDTVDVEDLRGKNIMLCCVCVPVYWQSSEASNFRKLPVACSMAFSGNYEVVVVPKMRPNWATDQDAFNHFLSGLPSSWLAIPFSHTLRRDIVCKSLGLVSDPICLFVDQNQKVLLHNHVASFVTSLIYNQDRTPWWKTHSQLDAVFGCKPSDCLHKINDASDNMVSVSELNKKLVGLYLCKDGSFIRTLNLVHQECKSKGLDFEIVLVYLPVCKENVNPQLFQDAINHVLHKLEIDSWWVLPYNDFRYHRFSKDRESFSEDELIIVGPHNEFVEPFGKDVISCFGFNAYPFTREHIVEKEYQEIRALTLDNLLGDVFLYHSHLDTVETPDELQGKTVLLYVDYALSLNPEVYFPLLYWYLHHKRTRDSPDDFEVVFVALDDDRDAAFYFPWFSCTLNSQNTDFIKNQLLRGRDNILAAFGTDGQILSVEALDLIESYDPDGIQSYEGLRNDVIKNMLDVFSYNIGSDVYKMHYA